MRPLAFASLLLLVTTDLAADDRSPVVFRIEAPGRDTIVLDEKLTVKGVADPGDPLEVKVNGATMDRASVKDGKWSIDVKLPGVGLHEITIGRGKQAQTLLVTLGEGFKRGQQRQNVCFLWSKGVDDELRLLARDTLKPPPPPQQLEAFVTGVRARTEAVFLLAFEGLGIELVDKPGNGVTTIEMIPSDGKDFGHSYFYDCGNTKPDDSCEIWVGTFRAKIVGDFNHPTRGWQPMDRGDDLQTRIEDVAQALGRTAAHEVGHCLGLVGQLKPCAWMKGCDGSHNCVGLTKEQPRAQRFASGRFIMDDGPNTLPCARIAEPQRKRSRERQPAVFNSFNRSYLDLVLPK